MAVKTKDINFDELNFVEGKYTTSGKGKTAIYFSQITKGAVPTSITMQITDDKLEISDGVNTLSLTNYSGIKYIKTDKSGKTYNLTDIIADNLVTNNNLVPYNTKKKAYIGTDYNDTFASTGLDDNFTGKKGENTFIYEGGHDTINLTKGETLNIDLNGNEITSYHQGTTKKTKNDLILEFDEDNTITLKNYYAKNTGAAVIIDGHNLVNEIGFLDTITAGNHFEIENQKAVRKYTGSALADKVDARDVSQLTDKKGRFLSTGVTINTGIGNDEIYGSHYDDTITGGVGTNTIHHYACDGDDTIVLTKGENLILRLDDINKENLQYSHDKKGNFKISYTQGDDTGSVTLKNFYKKDVTAGDTIIRLITSSGEISNLRTVKFQDKIVTDKNYTGSWLAEEIEGSLDAPKKKGAGLTLNGGAGDDKITGTDYKDTIKGGAGDDEIIGGKGDDKLYGEAGKNTIKFATGDGNDIVYSGKGEDTIVFEDIDVSKVNFTNKKKDLIIKYGEGDSVTVKDYYNVNKKGKVTGVNAKNSVKEISFGDDTGYNIIFENENGTEVTGTSGKDMVIASAGGNNTITLGAGDDIVHLGTGESTVKIDMSMFEESEWSTPEYTDYVENCVKTIYLNDDPASTLTLDFDKALFENGLGVFCRGTGQDRNLYISMSNAVEPEYGIVVKNYFDENGNPRTNQVKLGIWEFPDTFATQRVQQAYTVPDYACADSVPWVRTFDVQPLGGYTGEIRGTNMPHEVLLYQSGFGDDVIYGGNGNRDSIYLRGGHDIVYANEGDKHLNIGGNQTNVELYLGSKKTTTTNIHLGMVEGNVVSNINDAGDLEVSWDCYANNALEPYVYTSHLRVDKWNSRKSKATISMGGNNRDNTLKAVDGVDNSIDGGEGDDTLIGGTGADIFNFSYNSEFGVDTVQNYTSDDILQFESASSFPVDFSKFKYYTNNAGKGLVINSKDLSDKDSYVIIDNYFESDNKIDKVRAYNWSNDNEERSLATMYGNITDMGSFDLGTGGVFTGTDNQDVFIAKSGENTFTGGKGVDALHARGGDSTFVFNTGDGNDIVYQDGGNVTLKFNNATIDELGSASGYDKDSAYYDDLLIHYDGTNTLRVKDYYYTSKNKVTKIIDSTGTEYNMSDYFKRVQYINSYSDYLMRTSANKDEDIRVTANIGADIEGKKGSDIIRGSQYGEWLCSYTTMKSDYTFNFDKTAGVVDKIYAGGGNDTLIGNSLTNYLYGDGGNDTFVVFASEGLNTVVSDSSGTSDALNIYDETYDNLHFVFNADSDGNIDSNGLRILNNENFNLWKANVNDENIKGISIVNNWNCIENYEEAGDGDGCSHLTVATLETLKNEVVSWLTSGGRDYGSVSEVLAKENNDEDITALIAKFDISDKWVYQEY